MTGRQNVKFVARVHGGNYNVEDIIQRVQDFAEIGEAFDEPIKTYSSGMRARLNFGLSLAFDFDVYLSDEATAVGDRAFKAKASKAFKDKVGQASLIMVSHGEAMLKQLCQAGIYLKNGQATWFDDINDAIAAYHAETDAIRQQSEGGQAEGKKKDKQRIDSATQSLNEQKQVVSDQDEEISKLAILQQEIEIRENELAVAKSAFEHARSLGLVQPRKASPYRKRMRKAQNQLKKAQHRLEEAKELAEAPNDPASGNAGTTQDANA